MEDKDKTFDELLKDIYVQVDALESLSIKISQKMFGKIFLEISEQPPPESFKDNLELIYIRLSEIIHRLNSVETRI